MCCECLLYCRDIQTSDWRWRHFTWSKSLEDLSLQSDRQRQTVLVFCQEQQPWEQNPKGSDHRAYLLLSPKHLAQCLETAGAANIFVLCITVG